MANGYLTSVLPLDNKFGSAVLRAGPGDDAYWPSSPLCPLCVPSVSYALRILGIPKMAVELKNVCDSLHVSLFLGWRGLS